MKGAREANTTSIRFCQRNTGVNLVVTFLWIRLKSIHVKVQHRQAWLSRWARWSDVVAWIDDPNKDPVTVGAFVCVANGGHPFEHPRFGWSMEMEGMGVGLSIR